MEAIIENRIFYNQIFPVPIEKDGFLTALTRPGPCQVYEANINKKRSGSPTSYSLPYLAKEIPCQSPFLLTWSGIIGPSKFTL